MNFNAGSPIMVAGPTQCGKTQWVYNLLKKDGMFNEPISSIIYCYGVYQNFYDTMKQEIKNISFYNGVPSQEVLKEMSDGKFHVIVLDDLMEHIVRDVQMQMLFTKFCHHYHFTTIFITQNIFEQGRCARSIALNTHILVLFANKRDASQIRQLGKQQCPVQPCAFIEAYEDAISVPYGYLVVDCAPSTHDILRWRTNIFSNPILCYVRKNICYS